MTTSSPREELDEIQIAIENLEKRRRQIYVASLEAAEEDKVCSDFLAEMEAESNPAFQYPIQLMGINWTGNDGLPQKCKLVAVRPVNDDKTYVGVYVGDLPLGVSVSYDRKSQVLSMSLGHHNPAIVVPALNKIVMGCESWWTPIKNEEHLRKITDEDIGNVWYVKVMQSMLRDNKSSGDEQTTDGD